MRLPIRNGRSEFGATQAQLQLMRTVELRRRYGVELAPMTRVAREHVVFARVNWGRWIVDCPDCNNAEFAWPDEPIFMCTSCWNAVVDGQWRRVVFPEDREQIDRILLARPIPNNRNWEPGETVGKLRAENRAHGLAEGVD